MKRNESLISGPIGSALLAFVVPLMLSSLVQQLYVTADAVIVGHIAGKTALAAIDSVHTLFRFPINFMNGLAAGATILISRHFGAENRDGVRSCMLSAGALAVVLGILCAVGGVLLTPVLFAIHAGPGGYLCSDPGIYERIYFRGIWAMILYNMASGVPACLWKFQKSPVYSAGQFDYQHCGRHSAGGRAGDGNRRCGDRNGFCPDGQCGNGTVDGREKTAAKDRRTAAPAVAGTPGGHGTDRHSAGTAIGAVPGGQFHCAGSGEHDGNRHHCGLGRLRQAGYADLAPGGCHGAGTDTYTAQNMGAGRWDRVCKGNRIGAAMSVAAVGTVSLGLYFLTARWAACLFPCRMRRQSYPRRLLLCGEWPIFPVLCFGRKAFPAHAAERVIRSGP